MLLLNEISLMIVRKFKNKTKENTSDETKENTLDLKKDIDEKKINDVRERKIQDEEISFNDMQDIAKQYIIETFAPYCSNEDIKNLCTAVIDFSNSVNGGSNSVIDFSNYPAIKPKKLKTIDLMHFGWNMYNHFGGKKKSEMIVFLKNIFRETLIDVSESTLTAKLKSEGDKGEIKIEEKLLDKE